MLSRPLSKEDLLRQVDALREIARRGRRLSGTLELESDRRRLMAHMEEIEHCAARVGEKRRAGEDFPDRAVSGGEVEQLAHLRAACASRGRPVSTTCLAGLSSGIALCRVGDRC
jgi:hypothetical protein